MLPALDFFRFAVGPPAARVLTIETDGDVIARLLVVRKCRNPRCRREDCPGGIGFPPALRWLVPGVGIA